MLNLFASLGQVASELRRGHLFLPKGFATGQSADLLAKFKDACRRVRRHPLFPIVVSDYRPGDQAAAKVVQALWACIERAKLKIGHLSEVTVPELETYPCGWSALMQIGTFDHLIPQGAVGYLNVAPIYKHGERNGHHRFYATLLKNGRIVFSPNAGHSLTALLPHIVAIAELETGQEGLQFRSWQCFPQAVARFLSGDFSGVVNVYDVNGDHQIPATAPTVVADKDNFGNVRLNVSNQDAVSRGWREGDKLELRNGKLLLTGYYLSPPPQQQDRHDVVTVRAGSNIVVMGGERFDYLDAFVTGGSALEQMGGWTRDAQIEVVNVTRNERT